MLVLLYPVVLTLNGVLQFRCQPAGALLQEAV